MATTIGSSYKRMFNTRLFKKKQSREWSGLICLLEMKTCIHTLAVRLHPWRGIDSVTEQAIAGQRGAHYSRHTWTYNTQKDPQYCKRVKSSEYIHVSLIIQMRVHYPYGSLPVFIPILSWIVPFSLLENACSLIILWTDRANSAISITCLLLLRCGKPLTKKTCMISKRVQQRAEHLHIDNKIRNIRKWKLIENLRLWSK